jgi:hypothetical protein
VTDDARDARPVELHPIQWQEFPVCPNRTERLAMAGLCASLSVSDWILLESLSKQLRNRLLKTTIGIMLRWRARRTRRAVAK